MIVHGCCIHSVMRHTWLGKTTLIGVSVKTDAYCNSKCNHLRRDKQNNYDNSVVPRIMNYYYYENTSQG